MTDTCLATRNTLGSYRLVRALTMSACAVPKGRYEDQNGYPVQSRRYGCYRKLLFRRRSVERICLPTLVCPSPSLPPEFATAYCPASPLRRALTPECDRSRSPRTVLLSRQSLDTDCSFGKHAWLSATGDPVAGVASTGLAAGRSRVRSDRPAARSVNPVGSPAGAGSPGIGGDSQDQG
jgi:hypothetical protein